MTKKLILKIFQKLGYYFIKANTYNEERHIHNELLFLISNKDERYLTILGELMILARKGILPNLPLTDNKIKLYLLSKLLGTSPCEGLFIIDSIRKTFLIEGDICEFGVAQGATSALIANEIKDTNKNLWLFDSFKGLPKPTENDLLKDDIFNLGNINAYEGKMACEVSQVKQRLEEIDFPYKRVKIVSGFIEETIKYKNLPSSVSFAYIDFDFYEPIKLALNFLDTVLAKNGIMIIDDYDFFSTGVKTAVDEFIMKEKGKYQLDIPENGLGHFAIIKKL
jgi:O-methyltransferase